MKRTLWIVLALAGCATPIPAVPTAATVTKGMTVCWRESDAADKSPVRDFVATRLRGAGYVLVPNHCDMGLGWNTKTRWAGGGGRNGRSEHSHFSEATLVVRQGGNGSQPDALVDEVHWEFGEFDVPDDDYDRLAILFVNAVNASPKVAALKH